MTFINVWKAVNFLTVYDPEQRTIATSRWEGSILAHSKPFYWLSYWQLNPFFHQQDEWVQNCSTALVFCTRKETVVKTNVSPLGLHQRLDNTCKFTKYCSLIDHHPDSHALHNFMWTTTHMLLHGHWESCMAIWAKPRMPKALWHCLEEGPLTISPTPSTIDGRLMMSCSHVSITSATVGKGCEPQRGGDHTRDRPDSWSWTWRNGDT